MKRNTVGSILIALVLATVALPALAHGGNTVDPEKPSTATQSAPGR
ncbi:MAG TPA: hypothetical protein VEG34_04245 [Thermoanaerobaculia bacterium]|nr:hypothetical protein [Thermoanaerobaculia bacterium]